jgi:hypothetical protein
VLQPSSNQNHSIMGQIDTAPELHTMKPSPSSLSLTLSLCVTSLALSGCAVNAVFPNADAVVAPAQATMPGLGGSNYGGHAPIVGAKVFLLQAGQSGYGSKSTSLLTAAAGGTDMTIVGSSGSPAYYTTTDSSGYFNITGQYTCTAGLPVYLYAYSGAPDVNPSAGFSYIQSASGNGTTVTFVVGNEKFYIGQQVAIAGIPAGNPFVSLNGTTQTVTAISTTDNTGFSIASGINSTSSNFGAIATVSPLAAQNPGIVNAAVLGNCPTPFTISAQVLAGNPQFLTAISASDAAKLTNANVTANSYSITGPGLPAGTTITYANVAGGTIVVSNADTLASGTTYTFTVTGPFNFGSGSVTPINFVYMNEVSTAAAMFALAPFAETSTISGGVVTRAGTDAQHIGIPSGNSLALTGIQNAAINAGQLYDITGATNDASNANGEAHIARSVVPNSGTGLGVATVPQSLINTLGNILAQCVDSANTYGLGATGGTASPACKQLFQNATSNGIPVSGLGGGTTPLDTATAAINIAHYPAGNGASAGSFVSNIFNIPNGVVPFAPSLSTAPKDFIIGINITVPQGSNPTNYLGSSGTVPTNAIPTAIAAASTGEVYVGTTGCGSGGAESATNGYGCVLQIEPTQLLPAAPTVGGVGLAQGVRSISLGPSGKVWATGTLETGQTVGGYTPPPGAFYVVQNTPSATSPITYGTANGALSTSYNFASYGNVQYAVNPGTYPNYYGKPTAIAVNGNGHAYIADYTKNYLHDITGLATTTGTPALTYTATNYDSEYLLQGTTTGVTNCLASVSALAIGAASSSHGGAYNVWATSQGGSPSQGMCTIADPATGGLNPQAGNTPVINTVTPVEQAGAQYTPTWVSVDANDVGWDTNQSPGTDYASLLNQTGEAFPNNGVASYNGAFGFASSATTTPTAVAIDGNNNLWIANLGSNSVSVYTNPGVPILGTQATAISPAGTARGANNGGYTAGGTLSGPAGLAIDPSGDVWVINTSSSGVGYSVTELIGVAAPTTTSLAAAAANNKLGAKP